MITFEHSTGQVGVSTNLLARGHTFKTGTDHFLVTCSSEVTTDGDSFRAVRLRDGKTFKSADFEDMVVKTNLIVRESI